MKLTKLINRKIKILYERISGLDFSSVIQPEKLGLDSNTAFRGSPSGNAYLFAVLEDLNIQPQDCILDIGYWMC